MDCKAFGGKVLLRRKALRMTQEKLAELVGVSASYIGHLERGSRIPSVDTVCALCRVLEVPSDYLLGL